MNKEQKAFIKGFTCGVVYAVRIRMYWEAIENLTNQIEKIKKKESKIGSIECINGED